MEPVESQRKPEYHKNFWNLIEFFPAEKLAFEQSKFNWDNVSDQAQRSRLILIHDVAELYAAESLNKLLPPEFAALPESSKICILQVIAMGGLSKISEDEKTSESGKEKAFLKALEISLQTSKAQKKLQFLLAPNPIRDQNPGNILEEFGRNNPKLVVDFCNDSFDAQAIKTAFALLNTSPLWKLKPDEIESLVQMFPAKWSSENEDEYSRRKSSAQKNTRLASMGEEEQNELVEDVHHVMDALKLLRDFFHSKGLKFPQNHWRSEMELLHFCLDLTREAEACADDKKLKSRINEIAKPPKPLTVPDQVESLTDVIDIVEKNPQLKAVSFDLMDTLVYWRSHTLDRREDYFREITSIMNRYGINISVDEFKKIRGYRTEDHEKIPGVWIRRRQESASTGKEFSFKQVMKEIARIAAKQKRKRIDEASLDRMCDDIQNAYAEIEIATIALMPGAKETLELLRKRGIKIALLSNALESEEKIEEYLKKAGIREYFDVIKVSSEFGYQKNPTTNVFYDTVPRELEIPHEQIIHVGDNVPADVTGARRAGLTGIQFKQSREAKREARASKIKSEDYKEEKQKLYGEDLTTRRSEQLRKIMEAEGIPEEKMEEMAKMSMRMYELAREYYGPATLGFAVELIRELEENPSQVNLCVGRDSFTFFILQKMLLRYRRKNFPLVQSDRIQYLPISRKLVGGGDRDSRAFRERLKLEHPELKAYDEERLKRHIASAVHDENASLCIVDHGISGSTQNRFMELFPKKDIKGRYVLSRTKSPNERKKGYFLGYQHGLERDQMYDAANRSKFGREFRIFKTANAVRVLEDFFSGIQTSAEYFTGESIPFKGRTIEKTNQRKLGKTQEEKERKILKLMAVYGIIDTVKLHGDEAIDGSIENERKRIEKLANWVKSLTERPESEAWFTAEGMMLPQLERDIPNNVDAQIIKKIFRLK